MNRYTILCTEEQTRKALELGAPIEYASIIDIKNERFTTIDKEYYCTPTTEQMIGWLEDKTNLDSVDIYCGTQNEWFYNIRNNDKVILYGANLYISRKEATIAAIDAALDFLTNNKK